MAYTKVFQVKKLHLFDKLTKKWPREGVLFEQTHLCPFFSILAVFLNYLTTNDLNKHYIYSSYKKAYLTKNSLENFPSSRLFHTVISVVL